MKRVLFLIIVLAFTNSAFNQEFPPPTNFYTYFNADSITLNWEPPGSESFLQYNVYTYGYTGGQIIYLGSTTETSYAIPKPDFLYSINLGLSAEYINPNGESDTLWSFIGCPWLWLIPTEINFEDPEYYFCGTVANIMRGTDNWELTDSTSSSPSHSVVFYSDSLNFKSAYTTTVIEPTSSQSPALSFMYKIPQKLGKTDTLKLCYYSFGNYLLLTDSIIPTEDWQEYNISLESLPNSFHFAFEATSGGGGGVYLDEILLLDNIVSVPNHILNPSQLNVHINQNNSNLDLTFKTEVNTILKSAILSIDGKLVYNGKTKNLQKGKNKEFIDISHLNQGLYIVKLNLNNKVIYRKVIIN